MDNDEKIVKLIVCIPLVFGIVSVILHGIYLLDSYFWDSNLRLAFFVIPIISIFGLFVSLITRKSIHEHKVIWIAGFVSCLLCFLGFLVIEAITWYYLGLALG